MVQVANHKPRFNFLDRTYRGFSIRITANALTVPVTVTLGGKSFDTFHVEEEEQSAQIPVASAMRLEAAWREHPTDPEAQALATLR